MCSRVRVVEKGFVAASEILYLYYQPWRDAGRMYTGGLFEGWFGPLELLPSTRNISGSDTVCSWCTTYGCITKRVCKVRADMHGLTLASLIGKDNPQVSKVACLLVTAQKQPACCLLLNAPEKSAKVHMCHGWRNTCNQNESYEMPHAAKQASLATRSSRNSTNE